VEPDEGREQRPLLDSRWGDQIIGQLAEFGYMANIEKVEESVSSFYNYRVEQAYRTIAGEQKTSRVKFFSGSADAESQFHSWANSGAEIIILTDLNTKNVIKEFRK
jgi:hypothetical protein